MLCTQGWEIQGPRPWQKEGLTKALRSAPWTAEVWLALALLQLLRSHTFNSKSIPSSSVNTCISFHSMQHWETALLQAPRPGQEEQERLHVGDYWWNGSGQDQHTTLYQGEEVRARVVATQVWIFPIEYLISRFECNDAYDPLCLQVLIQLVQAYIATQDI